MPTVNLPLITMNLFKKTSVLIENIRNLIDFEYTPYMRLHYLMHQKSAVYGVAAVPDRCISGFTPNVGYQEPIGDWHH